MHTKYPTRSSPGPPSSRRGRIDYARVTKCVRFILLVGGARSLGWHAYPPTWEWIDGGGQGGRVSEWRPGGTPAARAMLSTPLITTIALSVASALTAPARSPSAMLGHERAADQERATTLSNEVGVRGIGSLQWVRLVTKYYSI